MEKTKATREEMKKEALERLKILNVSQECIYDLLIHGFINKSNQWILVNKKDIQKKNKLGST